jgi:hypothetical protein
VIETSVGRVNQVNGEDLDGKKVIGRHVFPAHEAVVLEPNVRIGFTVILDDFIGHSKTLREVRVAHVALECLGP